ncbi:kinase-like domain-containing protein [Tanacetum coccineum]|uniref:Kinase-like domain-containing protein n=1 Tax=Tanacetum coccineum TaxID=301880 RepID=A0ABQ4XZP3_9ASTR
MSPHLGNLSFFRELSLRKNSFQGTIPHELGRLFRLRRLNLFDNIFSGVIPANLSGCSNLEPLSLGGNTLAGSIPNEMSLLSKLAFLVIEFNKLTGGIPPFLGEYHINGIVLCCGNIPYTLGLWKSLTEFNAGECNVYGSIPCSIFNLSLLVNFSIAENHLTGSLPSEIGNQIQDLEWLQLASLSSARSFGLKNTDGTEGIDTIVNTSFMHSNCSPINSISANGGSNGNSTIFHPRGVRLPTLFNAPKTHN